MIERPNRSEWDASVDFDEITDEDILEEFMDACPVTDDTYVNYYGAFFHVMDKVFPTSRSIFFWMICNCELDRGRVVIQSLNQRRLLRELGISQVTYFKCLRDMKNHDLIRGCCSVYHINPKFAWRGTNKRRKEFMYKYPLVKNSKEKKVAAEK